MLLSVKSQANPQFLQDPMSALKSLAARHDLKTLITAMTQLGSLVPSRFIRKLKTEFVWEKKGHGRQSSEPVEKTVRKMPNALLGEEACETVGTDCNENGEPHDWHPGVPQEQARQHKRRSLHVGRSPRRLARSRQRDRQYNQKAPSWS